MGSCNSYECKKSHAEKDAEIAVLRTAITAICRAAKFEDSPPHSGLERKTLDQVVADAARS